MIVRAGLTIAAKDLTQRIRDRSLYLIAIAAPLGLALVFGFVLKPIQTFEFKATYAVADLDGGPVAALFVEQVLGAAEGIKVMPVKTAEEADELVASEAKPFAEEGSVDAAFVIPAGFSSDVQSERPVELRVIGRQAAATNAGIAVALAQGFASQLASVRVAVATVEALVGHQVDRLATGAQVLRSPNPVTLTDISARTKQLDGVTFYAAGMAAFFLFFAVQFGVNSLLEERQGGTLGRLLTAPIPKAAIILGKAISAFLVGIVSMAVMAVATTLLVGAKWGDPLGVALLMLAAVVAAMGIMAVVSAYAKTAEQASTLTSIVAMILGFLGGTFFDVSQAGGVLSSLRFVTPHAWFMQGLADLTGGDLGAVTAPVLALLAFGIVTAGLAVPGLNRRLAA